VIILDATICRHGQRAPRIVAESPTTVDAARERLPMAATSIKIAARCVARHGMQPEEANATHGSSGRQERWCA
jgi:hypothetical protein